MKSLKIIFFFLLIFCITDIYSQEDTLVESFEPFGVTISTGINNSVGLIGVGLYYAVTPNLILEGGVGQGSWGPIGALHVQYYLPNADNIYLRGAFKRSGGGRDIEVELELIDKSTQTVMLNFYPIVNAQFTAGKSWTIKNMHRFFIEGGYSYFFGVHEEKYRIQDSQIALSDNSKRALEISAPGGLVLAIGFAIGF